MLRMLGLRHRNNPPGLIKNNEAGTGRSLIDSANETRHFLPLKTLITRAGAGQPLS
jgi:hypothetical protein